MKKLLITAALALGLTSTAMGQSPTGWTMSERTAQWMTARAAGEVDMYEQSACEATKGPVWVAIYLDAQWQAGSFDSVMGTLTPDEFVLFVTKVEDDERYEWGTPIVCRHPAPSVTAIFLYNAQTR